MAGAVVLVIIGCLFGICIWEMLRSVLDTFYPPAPRPAPLVATKEPQVLVFVIPSISDLPDKYKMPVIESVVSQRVGHQDFFKKALPFTEEVPKRRKRKPKPTELP